MNLKDIENGTFKIEEYTFNKGQMNFIAATMFNYFRNFYEDYGLEEGSDMFQLFCQSVRDNFEETETDDINSVVELVDSYCREKEGK